MFIVRAIFKGTPPGACVVQLVKRPVLISAQVMIPRCEIEPRVGLHNVHGDRLGFSLPLPLPPPPAPLTLCLALSLSLSKTKLF